MLVSKIQLKFTLEQVSNLCRVNRFSYRKKKISRTNNINYRHDISEFSIRGIIAMLALLFKQ
jgi:hypothetical protein